MLLRNSAGKYLKQWEEISLKQYLLDSFFKKIILFIYLLLILTPASAQHKQISKIKSVAEMYEEKDLASYSLFAGGFINFGYWNYPLDRRKLSIEQRIESEKNLYRFVLKKLGINKQDEVLQIGIGRGMGTVLTFLEFQPKKIYGIDCSAVQIDRARNVHRNLIQKASGKLVFDQGWAENIPYGDNRFDVVFTIESAQHFTDVKKFLKESFRVLKPSGTLGIATFFATSEKSVEPLIDMIGTAQDGLDRFINIQQISKDLEKIGFKYVKIVNIGKNVWPGFDKWVSQGEFKNTWNRNWYKAYKQNLIGYYVVITCK